MQVVIRAARGEPRARLLIEGEERNRRDAARETRGLSKAAKALVERAREERLFRGRLGEVLPLLLSGKDGLETVVLLGIGPRKDRGLESLRRAFGSLGRQTPRGDLHLNLGEEPLLRAIASEHEWEATVRAIVEGTHLGAYRYDGYKSKSKTPAKGEKSADRKSSPKPRLILDPRELESGDQTRARRGERFGRLASEAVAFARDLANAPANELYPAVLATRARAMARTFGLRCRVLDEPALRRESMGAFLGVSQGSSRSPRLIVVEYRPSQSRRTLVLVGKAVTFDAGGLSIKPAQGMQDMKFDMAGGAAVLGALRLIAGLAPRTRVVGLVPAAENVIGDKAYRPGDILRSASGKTIEVINTDAEGRLLLADALYYARRFDPDAVVDVATLTGAVVIALGTHLSGLFSNDESLAESIRRAAKATGERVWDLPLFPEAFEAMKSQVADLKNSGGREAGSSTAAAFLASFTEGLRWAHLDIAGTAWTHRTRGELPAGATGVGVRLLAELADRYEKEV